MRVAPLLVLLFLVLVPVARAGTYDVTLCADPAATGFTERNDDRTALQSSAICPSAATNSDSGLLAGVKPALNGPGIGKVAGWTLAAPAGTKLRSLTYQRQYGKTTLGYEVSVSTPEQWLEGCTAPDTACIQALDTKVFSLNTSAVTFAVRCASVPCLNANGQQRPAWLMVKSATATFEDSVPPTVPAPTVPSGWQRSAAITVAAEDNTGVQRLVLRDGNTVLDTRAQACDFRHLRPCPAKVSASITPQLTDGVHQLNAVATDVGGTSTTSPPTLVRIDNTAPAAPVDLAVQRAPDGSFVYSWRNPDQGGASPIAAAHLSDGTVVKGANVSTLSAPASDLKLYLEDEAGNADPATAAGFAYTPVVTVGVKKPILQPSLASPKLKLTSAKRSGNRLTVKGTISRSVTARVTATLARGTRNVKGSAKPKGGRFTITLRLSSPLRRRGTNTLRVKVGGQGRFGAAAVSKKLAIR